MPVSTQQWIEAVDQGDLASLKQFHDEGWEPAQESVCPLARAALRAQPQLVEWFLELGLRPGPTKPLSALHCACSGQDSPARREVIEQLLSAGAALDSLNRNDRTPLMCALSVGSLDLAHHLISRGASWTRTNSRDQRAEDFFASGTPGAKERFQALLLDTQTAPAPKSTRSIGRL